MKHPTLFFIAAIGLFFITSIGYSDSHENSFTQAICSSGHLKRVVSVTYDDDVTKENCKVRYHKETEGQPEQILWTAKKQYEYCHEKASQFVKKLEGWGWSCEKS